MGAVGVLLVLMTRHGEAKVRPDGKVQMGLAVDAGTYRTIRAWAEAWNMTAGEAVERLVADARRQGPTGTQSQTGRVIQSAQKNRGRVRRS